jgi:acetyl-CoA carboxylase biotin carboxyl carrier protein
MNYTDRAELNLFDSMTHVAEPTLQSRDATAAIRQPVVNGQTGLPASLLSSSFVSWPQFTSTMVAPVVEENVHILKSQTVGIFHASKSPGTQPFVELGTVVKPGQIVGVIEILRLMIDVKSDLSGEIVKKLAGDGEPVEYGQPLFAVRSSQ